MYLIHISFGKLFKQIRDGARRLCRTFVLSVIMIMPALLLLFITGSPLYAQNGNNNGESVSINVSARVVPSEVQVSMETLRDMVMDRQVTRQGIVSINPMTDGQSGKMRAEGMANAEVRISFLEQLELVRVGGNEQLMFHYRVAGNPMDDRASAEILDLDNRDLILSEEGEYYFWIGGEVDIRNAVPGAYDGEFTIEIEYLES